MNKSRNSLDIIHDILLVIREKKTNVKPTHIMYKSNLSHKMLTSYLSDLTAKDFITEKKDKKGKKCYEITDKGLNYLQDFSTVKNFMESYGLLE